MIQPLGTRLSKYARTKKIVWQGTFLFPQPSIVGSRRSDAWLLNLIRGIYIFVFFCTCFLYLYVIIAILNH